jgi:adenylate cyclase
MLIAISSLQLDFKLSFLVGVVAAVQYSLLTYYSFIYVMPTSDMNMAFPSSTYNLRSFILLITGAAAALIAKEISNRVENSFKQLIEKQKIINLFGQQVSKEIVEELMKRKDSNIHRINATIMFLDIRNFSTYAEAKDPAEIIEFQNNIFNPLIEIITKHKGIVNQFMGDGFMASFGVPIENPEHVQNGFEAGLEIISKVKDLGNNGIIPKTQIGIGLHSGEIITGNVGNDIRKQFSITGTTVITSARLEQLNKQYKTQYLISKQVYQSVSKNGSPQFETMGEIAIKGYEHPLEVICVKV